MLEPPKMFSDARHTSDVLEIESLAKLVYELDIQMDSNLFQTFETLVELAGTKQFLQTFSRFQYYLLNLKFLQTGCYGLGHSVPFQNNSNLYPMMYPNQTPPSPTSPLPFTDVSGSSTSTSSTSNTTSSSSSSSSSIPTTNTTNASIPTAPLPGSAVGGMAGNPSTPPYGALGQSAIPPQNANFNMTAHNANPANPSVATTAAAGTTTNAATPFSPNDFYGFVGNGAAPDANTAALLNTPPNYFPNQAGMMTAAYPTQYDPTLMGMATPYGSMDAQGPMTGAANPLLATPMSTETSSSAATDMDIDYPLATIVESEAEKSEENLSSQSTLASIPTTSTISATNATATTATVITTATTAAIAATTTPITTNAVADSTIASTTITPTTINTTTSIAATTSSTTSSTTTTTTTTVNSTTSDKIDNTVKDITKEKELNEVKIDTEASSQEEVKKDMIKVEDISKDIAITSTITPITTTAVSTTATTTTSTTTTVTPTINISNDIKKEGENISLAVDTKTTTAAAATEVATATSTTASSEKKINSEIKIETLENKDEISTGNNANANANANTNTTVETTATPAEVNTAATVGNMANVANMANVPTVDPSIMATAAMEGQQPAAPPPPMVLTEMDKALYPTAATAAEGLAGQFPLPLGAPVFPYDDPSMLKRPDMNMNEMAFHLSNGGSASPMANYPGYGFNPVDKMGHPGAPNPTHLNGQAYPPSTMYNRYGPGPDGRVAPNAPATHYYNKVNPHYEHMNYGGAYPGYNPMGHQHPYVHRVYNNQTPLHKISLQQQYHMVKKNSSSSSKASKMNEMTKIKTYGNKKHSAENKKSGVYQNLYI